MAELLPKLRFQFPAESVGDLASEEIVRQLRTMDVQRTRKAVLAGSMMSRGMSQAYISVVAADGPTLAFLINCRIFSVEVFVEPAALDRSNPVEDEVFAKCAAIVGFMNEADVTDEEHSPAYGPFEFWNHQDDDAANWTQLATVWR